MKKDDSGFSKDDLIEIFGEEIKIEEKEKTKTAEEEIKEIARSIVINKSKCNELEILNKQKNNITSKQNETAKEEKELTFPDFLDEKIILEIFNFNEEIRKIIEKELGEIMPIRNVNNMLLRTLEKTAVNFLILKNTNFGSDGNLKLNGAIDTGRLMQNMEKYKTQIMEIDKEIENALKTLFNMRMNAIKAGLGQKYFETFKTNFLKKFYIIQAGYSNAIVNFFKKNILYEVFNEGSI